MEIFTRGNPVGAEPDNPEIGPFQQAYEIGSVETMGRDRIDNRLYASGAGHCERMETWQTFPGIREEQRPEMKLYQEMGKAAETAIQDSWFRAGILLFANMKTPENVFNLGGEVDGIVVHPRTGKIMIAEIKTCGDKMPTAPKPRHFAQAQVYSALLGLPAMVYYQSRSVATFNRGSFDLKAAEFEIPFNRAALTKRIERVALSALYAGADLTPPIPAGFRKTIECAFCPFYANCYKGEPPFYPPANADTVEEFRERAEFSAQAFMAKVDARRNGVLKFLSLNGSVHAKELLAGRDWAELVTKLI